MRQSGAAAFTDGKRWIQDSGLMLRLMQYAYGIGTPLISFLDDKGLTRNRAVNESSETVALGMKGMPAIAERIALQRELNLVSYSGIPLHLSGVSTAESVREIARAKAEGIPVTAEVYAYHLLLDDRSLKGFDSNYKTLPPLRSEKDVEALREGVLNGTIDVICSDHSPHEIEVKTVEFDFASAGMIGLESCFAVANSSFIGGLPLNKVYDLFVRNPRTILGMAVPVIEQGALANFTVFNRSDTRVFVTDQIRSKSNNTPFLGSSLTGFPVMCGNNGHFVHSR
jgi:dihydroorotase